MIRPLKQHLPELEQLKQEVLSSPNLLEKYLSADIVTGPAESVEYLEELKQQLNNDDTDD
jgi:hypothetical protein